MLLRLVGVTEDDGVRCFASQAPVDRLSCVADRDDVVNYEFLFSDRFYDRLGQIKLPVGIPADRADGSYSGEAVQDGCWPDVSGVKDVIDALKENADLRVEVTVGIR